MKTQDEAIKEESNRVCWRGAVKEGYNQAIREVREWLNSLTYCWSWGDICEAFDKKFGVK